MTTIGQVWVGIKPDAGGFGPLADAQIRKALAAIKPAVPVELKVDRNSFGQFMSKAQQAIVIQANLDARQAYEAIIALRARMEALAANLANLRITATDAGAEGVIAALQVQLAALAEAASKIQIGEDNGKIPKIAAALLKMEGATNRVAAAQLKGAAAAAAQAAAEQALADALARAAPLVADLQDRMNELGNHLSDLRLTATDVQAEGVIARLQSRLATLAQTASDVKFGADPVALFKTDAALRVLTGDAGRAAAAMARAQAVADAEAIALDNVARAARDAAELQGKLGELSSRLTSLKIGVDDSAALATIARLQVRLEALSKTVTNVRFGADPSQIAVANAAFLALVAATDKVSGSLRGSGAALSAFDALVARLPAGIAPVVAALSTFNTFLAGARGWVGALVTKIPLFGGALGGILPVWARSISVWHLGLDVIFELIAVWGAAAIAVGIFAYAASDAAKQVITRFQDMHTVFDATGQSVYPLTGAMEALHKAIQPEVYQLFGEAISVANRNTGEFSRIALGAGKVLEQLAARAALAIKSTSFDVFTRNAVSSLAGLGTAFGNVFGAIGNLLKVVPDYARYLLAFGVGFTGLLETVTRVLEPILRFGLAVHGAFIYIGLAVTAAVALTGPVIGLAGAFSAAAIDAGIYALGLIAVATNEAGAITATGLLDAALVALGDVPVLFWVGLVAAAVTGLILLFRSGSDATDKWTASLQKQLDAVPVTQAVSAALGDQALIAGKLATAQKNLNSITDKYTTVAQARGPALKVVTQQYAQQQGVVTSLTATQKQFNAEVATAQGRVSGLSKVYGSNTAALGLLNSAGITTTQLLHDNNDQWAIDVQQVTATYDIYRAMSGSAGQLNNDLDVLGRTVTDQYQAVQKLNQAWGTFISDVTSTQTSFLTYATGLTTLSQANLTAGESLATAQANVAHWQDRVNALTVAGQAPTLALISAQDHLTASQDALTKIQQDGIPTMGGLNKASLQLAQAFYQQVTNVDAMAQSWRTAGLGGKTFNQGIIDAIIPLEAYAKGNQAATDAVVALGQEAGYHGPANLQALNKYLGITSKQLGNTAGATRDLQKIATTATNQEALLTGAMQAQGSFITNQLIGDINQAILAYNGVQGAATAYGTALAQSGGAITPAVLKAQAKLVKGIVDSGIAAHESTPQIAAMIAKVLGITVPEALKLIAPTITAAGTAAQTSADRINSGFIKSLMQIGFSSPSINKDVTNFSNAILNSGDSSTKTQNARTQLIKDLEKAGVQAQVATGLVDGLQKQIDQLHGVNLVVAVQATGSGTVTYQSTGQGTPGFPIVKGSLHFSHMAGGGRVFGSGNGDTVPAMLTPGEVVVPRGMVQAGAVNHLRGKLPGFAAGGFVGVDSSLPGFPSGASGAERNWAGGVESGYAKAVTSAWQAQMKAFTAAQASLAAGIGAGIGIGGLSASSGYAAFQAVAAAKGWGAALLADWVNVEMREAGFNLTARNPSSGAYGMAQFINGPGEYAQYGGNATTYIGQAVAMANYISQRYGSPAGAWAHEQAFNWYDRGGILPAGGIGINTSGHAEMVTPASGAGSLAATNMRLDRLSQQIERLTHVTAAQGHQFAQGLNGSAARGASRGYYGG